ncbi:MAG TPA: amidase [Candidatus Dormibacteraeota bacterium]|nr:amidase [Candidatus Dormibacteraeota bacterium]
MNAEELAFSDALALGEAIARKRVSSLELTNLYLDRLERFGAHYGAVVTIMHERARSEAKAADAELARGVRRSRLHGVPYGVKDLLAAVGAPTTWGAAPYRNRVFNYDAAVVEKLKAAGAVLLVKLAMVELAGAFGYNGADASFTGPGRTPWNRDFWSGGSSSGPGAAVCAGLVGFAIGSETNGSILTPSAMCGVSGLRPTFGRVSRYGAMALMWSSDKLGPMARSARDTLAILRIVAGADARDESARTESFALAKRRPRVAVFTGARKQSQAEVVRNFDASLAIIKEFADVEGEVTLPDLPYGATIGALLNGESAAAFRDLIESGHASELQSPEDRIGGYTQYETRAVDYVDAMRRRRQIVEAVRKVVAPYDALLFPTLPTVAYPIGVPFDKVYPNAPGAIDPVTPGNLVGVPSMSVPNGFGEHHLPTGLGLLGNPWRERDLVALAMKYQARTNFHRQRPSIAS